MQLRMQNVSFRQITILRFLSKKDSVHISKMTRFNKRTVWSLFVRGYIIFRISDENFALTRAGRNVLDAYLVTRPSSIFVKTQDSENRRKSFKPRQLKIVYRKVA